MQDSSHEVKGVAIFRLSSYVSGAAQSKNAAANPSTLYTTSRRKAKIKKALEEREAVKDKARETDMAVHPPGFVNSSLPPVIRSP